MSNMKAPKAPTPPASLGEKAPIYRPPITITKSINAPEIWNRLTSLQWERWTRWTESGFAFTHEIYQQQKHRREHHSRKDAGDKQLSYGCIGHDSVDNEDNARGDKDSKSASGGNATGC